jgi:Predicted AAA-ATPase
MPDLPNLPKDVSTFDTIISNNYIYVDKTKYIYDLYSAGDRYYFLSRPRRFGKSLLISTLKELFSGNKKLFNGLWIGSSDYTWQEYPVIYLDFSAIDHNHSTVQELKLALSWTLSE